MIARADQHDPMTAPARAAEAVRLSRAIRADLEREILAAREAVRRGDCAAAGRMLDLLIRRRFEV